MTFILKTQVAKTAWVTDYILANLQLYLVCNYPAGGAIASALAFALVAVELLGSICVVQTCISPGMRGLRVISTKS